MDALRVLIADDHPLFRKGMRALLTATPEIEVVGEAATGQEAIELAASLQPEVILMDLQMPRLGGVEATKILRERGYSRPIVALTAHALKEDRVRCLSVGCTDYLTKPIERAHLVRVLEKVTSVSALTGFQSSLSKPIS